MRKASLQPLMVSPQGLLQGLSPQAAEQMPGSVRLLLPESLIPTSLGFIFLQKNYHEHRLTCQQSLYTLNSVQKREEGSKGQLQSIANLEQDLAAHWGSLDESPVLPHLL